MSAPNENSPKKLKIGIIGGTGTNISFYHYKNTIIVMYTILLN